MRHAAAILILLTSSAFADDNPPPEPDSLMNWLKIIDVPGYRLLHASEQNEFFFAVKIDSDGDILFCHYEQSKSGKGTDGVIRIADPASQKDLRDPESKKTGPVPVTITYTREINDDGVKIKTSSNTTFSTGVIYPLGSRDIGAVKITYIRENDLREKTTLFDQLVQIPKHRPIRPAATR